MPARNVAISAHHPHLPKAEGGELASGGTYGPVGSKTHTDRRAALAALAGRQHGVVSRRQLRSLGVSDREIARAIEARRLHRIFRGAFAVGHANVSEHGRLTAACLACGDRAFVSHRSAGALLGLLDRGPAVIDLIASGEQGRGIDGIRFHRVRGPRRDEVGTVDGIPCTGPARTLVDLAGAVGDRTLRSCFERAAQRQVLDIPTIEASMDLGRRGNPSLRTLIDEWRKAAAVAKKGKLKSPLEARVLPLLVHRNIAPLLNAPVEILNGRLEVDFLWPDHRLVVEADSRDFHATDIAFERDRWRDRELFAVGYSTLRITHRQAERESNAVASAIAARLSHEGDSAPHLAAASRS
ncbi:MAG TPA: type IV toxin-antitoxin system AbiEi family antitoxin domain-containing protein [Solirubrobacterales bacterium]|nr:type IV toxin-antitoxin system AbiEi family antitoxin domain-containing protein [Solirubrobacterales bacterium]